MAGEGRIAAGKLPRSHLSARRRGIELSRRHGEMRLYIGAEKSIPPRRTRCERRLVRPRGPRRCLEGGGVFAKDAAKGWVRRPVVHALRGSEILINVNMKGRKELLHYFDRKNFEHNLLANNQMELDHAWAKYEFHNEIILKCQGTDHNSSLLFPFL